MGEESSGNGQPSLRLDWIGSRPAVAANDWPACMSSDDFDCSACEFVEPQRCDYRRDHSFLNERRRRLTFEVRRPRPGLEATAYENLLRRKTSVYYRDLAQELSRERGYTDPVMVLEVLQAGSLFLDMGGGYFRAISRVLDFEDPTDNLWYRLPPYEDETKATTIRDARRLGVWLFVRELGDDPTVATALMEAGGWRRYPSDAEIAEARQKADNARVRQAGIELVAQLARRSPRPKLSEPLEVESIARLGLAARRRMIEDNLRLVWMNARGIAGRGLDYVDLCQEGVIGLMTAVEKFNPELGWAFSTYATHWVRQAMTRAVADKGRLIRVPVHLYEKRPFLHKEHLGYRIPVNERPSLRPILFLDEVPESRHPAVEWQEAAELSDVAGLVRRALTRLTDREQRILTLRFGLEDGRTRTLEEIGQEFSVTRERIRQIEAKALLRLSHPSRKLHRLVDRKRVARWVDPNVPPWIDIDDIRALSRFEAKVLTLRFGIGEAEPLTIKECEAKLGIRGSRVLGIEQRVLRRLGKETAERLRTWRWAHRAGPPASGASAKQQATVALDRPSDTATEPAAPAVGGSQSPSSRPRSIADLPPPDPALGPEDILEEMRRNMKRLSNSERLVLTKRLGLDREAPLSVDEVVYLYRYRRERVRAIERSAVLKLDPRIMAAVAARLDVQFEASA